MEPLGSRGWQSPTLEALFFLKRIEENRRKIGGQTPSPFPGKGGRKSQKNCRKKWRMGFSGEAGSVLVQLSCGTVPGRKGRCNEGPQEGSERSPVFLSMSAKTISEGGGDGRRRSVLPGNEGAHDGKGELSPKAHGGGIVVKSDPAQDDLRGGNRHKPGIASPVGGSGFPCPMIPLWIARKRWNSCRSGVLA